MGENPVQLLFPTIDVGVVVAVSPLKVTEESLRRRDLADALKPLLFLLREGEYLVRTLFSPTRPALVVIPTSLASWRREPLWPQNPRRKGIIFTNSFWKDSLCQP